MTIPELREKIWRQIEPTVFISRREFMADLEHWTIAPKEIDGVLVGATLTRGADFHFVSFGLHKAFPASLIADCLQPIIDRYGFVRTKTPKDDMRQSRFNTLIGFKADSSDEYYTYFRMERLNLRGGQSCQSLQ